MKRASVSILSKIGHIKLNDQSYKSNLVDNGGAYRDRTDDPLLAKQVLSQLS